MLPEEDGVVLVGAEVGVAEAGEVEAGPEGPLVVVVLAASEEEVLVVVVQAENGN